MTRKVAKPERFLPTSIWPKKSGRISTKNPTSRPASQSLNTPSSRWSETSNSLNTPSSRWSGTSHSLIIHSSLDIQLLRVGIKSVLCSHFFGDTNTTVFSLLHLKRSLVGTKKLSGVECTFIQMKWNIALKKPLTSKRRTVKLTQISKFQISNLAFPKDFVVFKKANQPSGALGLGPALLLG